MKKKGAWIRMDTHGEESEELLAIYKEYNVPAEQADHILAIHSAKPETLRSHMELYRQLMFGASNLSRIDREMIAVVVSVCNECHY